MNKITLIINADDFGYDSDVNHAILTSFSKGFCSSTSIIPNMPGFEEACQLCHENNLTEYVGLHLVLSEGIPLTDRIKKCPRFCDKDGRFCHTILQRLFKLNSAEKDAIPEEICAQIIRCRKYGIPITHIDSHGHVHNEWAVIGILLRIAKNKKVRYIRLARNCGSNIGWIKRVYKRGFNFQLKLAGVAATKYFGSIEDFVHLKKNVKHNSGIRSFEVMIHPAFDQEQVLIDKYSKGPLEQNITKVDGYKHAISFSGVARTIAET